MATRSTIAILQTNGQVQSIYCHWDGDIRFVGARLLLYYQEPEKVKELISYGSLSSLGGKIHPIDPVQHKLKTEDDTCYFYSRDAEQDDGISIDTHEDLKDYIQNGSFEEYDYLYNEKNKKWVLLDKKNDFKPLALKTLVKKLYTKKELPQRFIKDFEFFLQEQEIKKTYNKVKKEVKNENTDKTLVKKIKNKL